MLRNGTRLISLYQFCAPFLIVHKSFLGKKRNYSLLQIMVPKLPVDLRRVEVAMT